MHWVFDEVAGGAIDKRELLCAIVLTEKLYFIAAKRARVIVENGEGKHNVGHYFFPVAVRMNF
jgi:hypothetical protein